MKTIGKSIILCITMYALALGATAQTNWKLSRDLLATNNQISFNQGANGVWYFLQSSSFKHKPNTYKLLPAYSEPCMGDATGNLVDGLGCWQNPIPDSGTNRVPLVAVNFTYKTQVTKNFGIPSRSVTMHPSSQGLAIIGWKSPITGTVDITGYFSDIDPTCDNGVIWSVDKGSLTLTSGTIPNGGPPQSFSLAGVPLAAGQVLYFTVDPNHGDYACDSTGVDITIKLK